MVRTCGENIRGMDVKKNAVGEIILRKKEGMTTYKVAGQCDDGGQSLERKRKGQCRLEESCEGSQSPPRALVLLLLLLLLIMMMMMMSIMMMIMVFAEYFAGNQ